MAEIGISIASKVAEYLVDPVVRHARYLICFNHFIRDIESAKSELESTLAGIKEHEKEVAQRTEEITETVKKWINDVENVVQEVQKLKEKAETKRNMCLQFSFRYSLAKEMENKTQQMKKLNGSCKFESFSHPIQLPGIHYFSTKDFVFFNSTKSAFNELLKAIKDDNNNRIGLYGIGGSGKTTLAKEVGKKVGELRLFDKVIMAVVSQPPNVRDIQDRIADQIGFKLEEQSDSGRAQRLSTKLQSGRFFIILDDVWRKLNLEDIGIPAIDNEGCCVLLTTRLRRVCESMNCQSITELPLLNEEEAQSLFNQRANITNDSSIELKSVAKEIASECKGLPIAIVTVGTTLRVKSFVEWELALLRLKQSQPMDDLEEDLRSPYACLELSYDNLKSQVTKSLFLLCSMFPEDLDINKEDLVRFGKGVLEQLANIDTMEGARREIYAAINILLDSCLLMPSDETECVKMHDLVRGVALWIARKQGQAIMVASKEVPRILVENELVKDTKVISLWDLKKDFKLFHQLKCLTLKTLLLHSIEEFFREPNTYVGGMKELKVLALIRFDFEWEIDGGESSITWPMPQSIELLTNLHTLCLRGNSLGDISNLGNVKGLEILDLRGSSFNELPIGIVKMKKLKLLDLWSCLIKKSPYEVTGRCTQLQELYMCDQSKCPDNVSFPRLQRFAIYLSFQNARMSSEDNSDQVDESMFSDFIEHMTAAFDASRTLLMEGYKCPTLSSSLKDLLTMVTVLCLSSCPDIKILVDNSEEEHLKVNLDLTSLTLLSLPELEYIWKGPPQILNLYRLHSVVIEECPKLKTIFTRTICTSLPQLGTLIIREYNQLEQIFPADLEQLTNPLASTCASFNIDVCFPRLSYIRIWGCNKLKCLFSYSVACHCPSLMRLKIEDCSELEQVVDGNEAGGHEAGVLFPKLKYLRLRRLPKLAKIFPGFKYDRFLHDIEDCLIIPLE